MQKRIKRRNKNEEQVGKFSRLVFALHGDGWGGVNCFGMVTSSYKLVTYNVYQIEN